MHAMKDTAVSLWLQEQLRLRGKSQTWLMEQLGVAHGTVNHWISGRRIPGPRNCHKIARALGVSPDELLAIAGHRPLPVPVEQMSPEATIIAKAQTIDWLRDPAVYRLVRDMLDNIIESQRATEPPGKPVLQLVDTAE